MPCDFTRNSYRTFPSDDFRCHVNEGAGEGVGDVMAHAFGDGKIPQFRKSLCVDQDILRLQIAIRHTTILDVRGKIGNFFWFVCINFKFVCFLLKACMCVSAPACVWVGEWRSPIIHD